MEFIQYLLKYVVWAGWIGLLTTPLLMRRITILKGTINDYKERIEVKEEKSKDKLELAEIKGEKEIREMKELMEKLKKKYSQLEGTGEKMMNELLDMIFENTDGRIEANNTISEIIKATSEFVEKKITYENYVDRMTILVKASKNILAHTTNSLKKTNKLLEELNNLA